MEITNLKFFIYVRKSTETEERQARSIGDQLSEIRELVRKEGLEVVGSFEESQSAKFKGRPCFNEMLDRIEAGEADGIISWHPDRLARNAFDGGRIIDLIDQEKIRDLRFCTFWFEPTAQGKLMLNLAFGQSKYYSDNLSVNIRRAQKQKTHEGVWSWKAPLGYLNDPKSRTIVIDPKTAPIIKELFDLYATGQYSFDRLFDLMSAHGLRGVRGAVMSPSRYQYLLTNPFYVGMFRLKGELFEGSHEPLVSKSLFDRVQEAMKRRSKPSPIRLKSYVYRGLFHCGECGCIITMETQKGYNYLRCTKRVKKDCSQRYIREENITQQIAAVLTSVSLPDDVADWMIQKLDADREAGSLMARQECRKIEKKIEAVNLKLDRLTAAYLDAGAFSAAEFRKRKEENLLAKRKLTDTLVALQRKDVQRFEPAKRFISRSKQAKYVARELSPATLRAELENIGSNLQVRERKLHWSPRDAWQLVVDQGSFAQHNAALARGIAAFVGETRLYPGKWSDGESNPDLLNAIQPSSR